jgi:hypothetical protein
MGTKAQDEENSHNACASDWVALERFTANPSRPPPTEAPGSSRSHDRCYRPGTGERECIAFEGSHCQCGVVGGSVVYRGIGKVSSDSCIGYPSKYSSPFIQLS